MAEVEGGEAEPLSRKVGVSHETYEVAVAYARAVAITERLAHELFEVTGDLSSYVESRKQQQKKEPRRDRRRA